MVVCVGGGDELVLGGEETSRTKTIKTESAAGAGGRGREAGRGGSAAGNPPPKATTNKRSRRCAENSPTGSHATITRLTASTLLVSPNPLTPGRRSDSGTTHPSSAMSPFCTHRSAVLCWILPTRRPGLPLRTMKALTALVCVLRAQMTTTSANGALPIQRLPPSRRQPFPSGNGVAVVERDAASEPNAFSVKPHAPTASIRRIFGTSSRRCSSVPSMPTVSTARKLCTR